MAYSGADLRGGGMAPGPAAGPTGAQLAQGPQAMQPEGERQGELDQAIAEVIQAAQSVGFELPPEGVSQEQLPQVYAQLLAAAAQSPMGRSPDGMQLIEQLAQTLGVPSPFGGEEGMEPGMEGGELPPMQGGMPPGGGPMPPMRR